MTRARFLKIAAGIFVAGIAVGALCTAIIAPVGFGKLADRIFGQIEPEFEQRRDNQRRYYESLPPANLTPDQIIARMQEDKGLHDQKLARMVEWYLYARKFEASEDVRRNDHLNPDDLAKQVYDYFTEQDNIIRQLVENLHYEVSIRFAEESGSGPATVDRGMSSDVLRDPYNLLPTTNHVLYEKLHEYSEKDADPHFIYLLLELKKQRPDGYSRLTRYIDMLAFLKIYARYKGSPTLRRRITDDILDYPGEWRDDDAIEQVLHLGDEEGAQQAYELYLKRYKSNYHCSPSVAHDTKRPQKVYQGRHEFEWWPGQTELKGALQFYDVDSNNVVYTLKHVVQVHSIIRNSVDITSQCPISPDCTVDIPLLSGTPNEIEYEVSTGPQWWQGCE